ncbi:MAG: DMT family transporter [Myxococcales bacterium]|nr:DMT family transporter [Myxococcales bacterium]
MVADPEPDPPPPPGRERPLTDRAARLPLIGRGASAGPAMLVVSSLLFGLMAFIAKQATLRLPGPEVAFVRFLIGLGAVAVAVALGIRLRPVNWFGLFLRGLFGGIAVLLYFITIEKLPVGTATLLNYTAPVFTALFAALFLGEKVALVTAGALIVTFAGVVLVLHGHAAPGRLGIGPWEVAGLASALLSGAAVTTIRAVRRTDGSWEIFGAFCVVGAAVTAPQAVGRWVAPAPRDWALLVAVGLVSVLAQVLFIHALRYVRAATSGVISQLTPVTALVLGIALLHEPARALALVGSAITLAGVAWGARPAQAEAPRT